MKPTLYPDDLVLANAPFQERSEASGLRTGSFLSDTGSHPRVIPGIARTTWLSIAFARGIAMPADFEEPGSIEKLALEQKCFLASVQEPLEDVELPADD